MTIDPHEAVTLARSLHEAAVQQIALTIPAEALDAAVAEVVEFDKIYAAPRPDRELYADARRLWAERQPLARLYARLVGLAEAAAAQEEAAGRARYGDGAP